MTVEGAPLASIAPSDLMKTPYKALLASSVGNFIEWYDFAVYGFMATVLADLFFPSDSATASLLQTFAASALAFCFRPAGALAFGWLSDYSGRRASLVAVLTLMAVSTTAIGCLPSYSQIGAWAPALLISCRIMQGLSAGGEFGGAVSFMMEYAPQHRRGLYSGWQSCTTGLAFLTCTSTVALTSSVVPPGDMYSWGWRVPFLLGAPLGFVALYLRLRVAETPLFRQAHNARSTTVRSADGGRRQYRLRHAAVMFALGTVVGWVCASQVFLIYMPTYLKTSLHMSLSDSLIAASAANAAFTLFSPVFGWLSDRAGRKLLMIAASAVIAVGAYPLFLLLDTNTPVAVLAALAIGGALVAALAGPAAAMLSELFPTTYRSTGAAASYSLAVAVLGGTAPIVITWFSSASGDHRAGAYYVSMAALLSLVLHSRLDPTDHQGPLPSRWPVFKSGDRELQRRLQPGPQNPHHAGKVHEARTPLEEYQPPFRPPALVASYSSNVPASASPYADPNQGRDSQKPNQVRGR
jgi:MFS transporter, MHS family, proline/betaine transporter